LGLLTVYGDSRKSNYVTLVTPECMSTIEQYLEQRRKQGETLNEKSCHIRDKYAIYSKRINVPTSPKVNTINVQMRFLVRKAGLAFEELQPDHAFRKFFNSALMNSDVAIKFKELMMGHSIKLDDVYYDRDSETSSKKIRLEYMKAVDALTINDEFRLRKQIAEHEEKLKQVPKVEQLQEQLASRIIEEDSIKRQLERFQKEKELEAHTIQSKYEQEMKSMREQMNRIMEMVLLSPSLAQAEALGMQVDF
jgi:hypothetical protein